MTSSRNLLLSALLCATVGTGAHAGQSRHSRGDGEPGRFDYYAVALSWSPAFCATHDDPNQCARGRQNGFVLHGLWPQYAQGYPQQCSSERLPSQTQEKYAALYPSPKMISHEWQKHGTCSGLNPPAYFELSARLKDQLAIPAPYQRPLQPVRTSYGEFVQAFRAANPRLAENAVLPFCGSGGRFLNEIHVCYDKRGGSTSCGPSEVRRSANTCRQPTFLMQSVR
ncbi:MAG: Ribonuclease [Massilia sp.]|jgi:ribonuclease T2|nr:Ribonuclease [Massilia sp.]